MRYNLDNPLQKQEFLLYAARLAEKGGVVELTKKKPRSLSQNSYLHSILAYFGMRYGETAEYVKIEYFKKLVNPDIFWTEKESELRGKYQSLRSTAALTSEEMSLCIDRFLNWSAKEAGIYLPCPNDAALIEALDNEIHNNRRYL